MARAQLDGLNEAFSEAFTSAADIVTDAVMEGAKGLQGDWRNQVLAAGLGQKMANTVRLRLYPSGGKASIDPAGYIWSKAPGAMDAFDRGPVIVPINGRRYLAIPSENVPRYGRYNRRMTPAMVEKAYGQDLVIIKGKKGNWLGFIRRVVASNKRGFTVAKTALKRAGRDAELVFMFTFARNAYLAKRIDLDSAALYWADQVATRANSAFGS